MDKNILSAVSAVNPSQVIIRKMIQNDLPALEWNGEYAHFRQVYQDVFKRIQKGTAVAWIAEFPFQGVVGQVFLQLNCDRPELADGWNRAYLYSFRLKPPYRNLGIGSRMLEEIEHYLRIRSYTRVTLNVARENEHAIRFYKRHDFQIMADEPGIWSFPDHEGNWHTVQEPSWRMEKLIEKKTL